MNVLSTEFVSAFESKLRGLLPHEWQALGEAIRQCVQKTDAWVSNLPAATSGLNIRTYFIRCLSETVPIEEALQDAHLLSVLLDDVGIRKVGDSIELNGGTWKIVWRRLSPNFGVEFGLSNQSGVVTSHVFLD